MNTNHFPSLELCKRLTEIGFPKTQYQYKNFPGQYGGYGIAVLKTRGPYEYVCPSVMELLDVIAECKKIDFEITPDTDNTYSIIARNTVLTMEKGFDGTLPNALAEMVVWLYENKYIKF